MAAVESTDAPGPEAVPAAPGPTAVEGAPQADASPAAADAAGGAPPPKSITGAAPSGGGNGLAAVTVLASKYRTEFEQTFEGLRLRAKQLQETAPQLLTETQAGIEPYKQEFVSTVQAVGEVSTPASAILGALSWSSILVLTATITSVISGYIFAPILSAAIGQLGGAALALAAVPGYGWWSIKQDLAASVDDVTIRFRLLLLAGIEGLIVGFILQNSYLAGAPLAALVLGITAIGYPIVSEKFGNNRQLLLGGSVGSAIGITLTVGFLTGSLTASYLLLTILYGGITAVTLQYIYKNVTSESAPTYFYQLALLTAFTAANLSVHLLLGMSADAYAQYQNGSK